jgi:hypothetical protein
MRCVGGSDITAAWQVGCGRLILEQSFEHCVWSARHSEHPGKDHNRRRSSFHVNRLDAVLAGDHGFALCVAVDRG